MTTMKTFNITNTDKSWHDCLKKSLCQMDQEYLNHLYNDCQWIPNHKKIFSAFSIPAQKVKYVLFGESPYPRVESANGYAFWDSKVVDLWSETGLNKNVNRATSLRNIIKMLLLADNKLKANDLTQDSIARINKNDLIQTNDELFYNLTKNGFLLLNASPVLQSTDVKKDAKQWQPFIKEILKFLYKQNPKTKLILFGKIAKSIDKITEQLDMPKLYSEHPYNLSFITNKDILNFFKPLQLLKK